MAEIEEKILARLAAPDMVTPGQYHDSVHREQPETHAIKRLMYALLSDALRCFQTYANASDREGRRIFDEVDAWISARDAEGPCAFETICETLGIEPGRLRDSLDGWRVQKAGRINLRYLGKLNATARSVGPIGSPKNGRLRRKRAAEGKVSRCDPPVPPPPLAASVGQSQE
jgi:hypothetical protein